MTQDPFLLLGEILRNEREAIGRLDGERVLELTSQKGALIAKLRRQDGSLSEADGNRLRALMPALRHNTILMAHARNILRDALLAMRASVGAEVASRVQAPPVTAQILSVRG